MIRLLFMQWIERMFDGYVFVPTLPKSVTKFTMTYEGGRREIDLSRPIGERITIVKSW